MSEKMDLAFERGIASPKGDLRVRGYGNRDGRRAESIPNYCTSPPDRWGGTAGLVGGDRDDLRIFESPLLFCKGNAGQIDPEERLKQIQEAPMPFGSEAPPPSILPWKQSIMKRGHQCLSAARPPSPHRVGVQQENSAGDVTNAFRQGGPSAL
jgi:hypothetical protein